MSHWGEGVQMVFESEKDGLGKNLTPGSRHYSAFVGSAEKYDLVAAAQFNLLTFLGLREHHYLLDVGCGSLRGGRLFITYLLPGRYFGIEPQQWLIEEAVRNELGEDIMDIKQPVFSYDKNFTLSTFNRKFDFIIACSIFSHASQTQIRRCLSEAKKVMKPTSIFVATFREGDQNYTGEDWSFPAVITYTLKHMTSLVEEQGLVCRSIFWPNLNQQRWIAIVHPENEKSFSDLGLALSGQKRLARLEGHPYVRLGLVIYRAIRRIKFPRIGKSGGLAPIGRAATHPKSALSELRKALSIKSQVHPDEVQLLFRLAKEVSRGCILEVGSYRGRSTVALALGSQHGSNVPVYAVEPHEEFTGVFGGRFGPGDRCEFFKNMIRTKCARTVRLINVSSEVVSKGWDKPIGLLWIDGDHRYEAVKRDFECWEPYVLPQGLVAFHDSLDENIGPAKVIKEALSSGKYQKLYQICVTTVLQKTA